MNHSKKIVSLIEQKQAELSKGDEVKVNMSKVKGLEPYLKLVRQVIKKAEGKPVVIRVADDTIDIAESPAAGSIIGTVQVPKSAVSRVGGKDDHEDTRMDVDAEDQIKPLKKKEGMTLAGQLTGLLNEQEPKRKPFKSVYADEFKVGDKVELQNGILGTVAMIYKRYLDVKDGDGQMHTVIPAHGEVKHADQ